MCGRYVSPSAASIEALWEIKGARNPFADLFGVTNYNAFMSNNGSELIDPIDL